MKPVNQLGLDLPALTATLSGSFALAFTWVLVGLATDVLEDEERRYSVERVLLTWLIAAPSAQALKLVLEPGYALPAGSYAITTPAGAATDIVMTLFLMGALRVAEQRGLL